MLFSQRMGITPLTKSLQLDSMDDELKIGLWNVFSSALLSNFEGYREEEPRGRFCTLLWHNFFKWQIETIPEGFFALREGLNNWFFHKQIGWDKIYDFLEITSNICATDFDYVDVDAFYNASNNVLEREFSAYRFINGILSPISNESEKSEIESALNKTSYLTALNGCNVHLTQSLKLLSDKTNPDYRNSIKESISAVESVAKVISGNKKDELGTALAILKDKANLNGGLIAGFKSIYGWTSNSDGIRHGLMDESNCDFDDAKYMLVSCSAFINYLISKSQKTGILIS